MYFDINVNEDYDQNEIQEINQSEYNGIVLNKTITSETYTDPHVHKTLVEITKSVYKRIEIEILEDHISSFNIKRVKGYDVVSLRSANNQILKSCVEWCPDLITFNYRSPNLRPKEGLIRDAIKKGIYFEIPLVTPLYDSKIRVSWMRNIRSILKASKGRNIVIGSGAITSTEIKRPVDIAKMMSCFGLSEDKALRILEENSYKFLRSCALKRYSYRGVIANNIGEGRFKDDFILNGISGGDR